MATTHHLVEQGLGPVGKPHTYRRGVGRLQGTELRTSAGLIDAGRELSREVRRTGHPASRAVPLGKGLAVVEIDTPLPLESVLVVLLPEAVFEVGARCQVGGPLLIDGPPSGQPLGECGRAGLRDQAVHGRLPQVLSAVVPKASSHEADPSGRLVLAACTPTFSLLKPALVTPNTLGHLETEFFRITRSRIEDPASEHQGAVARQIGVVERCTGG